MLVFMRTKRGADKLVKTLLAEGVRAEAIHGDKSQGARQKALEKFKRRSVSMLVATDVASRGLDITDISHVINFDLPEDAETYIHRIGRTGRAGATGISISFCSHDERNLLRDINKLAKNNIEVVSTHPFSASVSKESHEQSHSAPRHEHKQKAPNPNPNQERRFVPRRNNSSSNSNWRGGKRSNDRSYR